MASISQQIPTLLGGVSQQPDPLKLPGQVRTATNVLLDPTFGAVKRPATNFIKQIMGSNNSLSPKDRLVKWFPIFRGENERYIGCAFKKPDNTIKVRVWDVLTGDEVTVNSTREARDYLASTNMRDKLKTLTINDYTFITNDSKKVVANKGLKSAPQASEALVVVNQVAYNTTYSIDILQDGDETEKIKDYYATQLKVIPSSFEVEDDDGGCEFAGFIEEVESNGLKYRLTTNCSPTTVTTEVPGATYPVAAVLNGTGPNQVNKYAKEIWGSADDAQRGTYLYTFINEHANYGGVTFRVEFRVVAQDLDNLDDDDNIYALSGITVASYGIEEDKPWRAGLTSRDYQGTAFLGIKLTSVREGPSTYEYTYKSVYRTSVQLLQGGSGVRKGDIYEAKLNGKTYQVKVKKDDFRYSYSLGADVSYTTPTDTTAGPLDIGTITAELVKGLQSLPKFTSEAIGNTVRITDTRGRDFNVNVTGGSTNDALTAFKGSVDDVSRLPTQCFDGVVLKVANTDATDADDYYVKFTSSEGSIPGQGSWVETVAPNITTDLNADTMPHALIRQSDGSFLLTALGEDDVESGTNFWAGREVGDDSTNPMPSFVGRSITNICFYMNRLGFLSEDAIVMSQPGDYFNFFQGSAIAVSDADPIDMTASSIKPAFLKSSINTPRGLILFAENSQHMLSTQEVAFGPITAKMTEISSYSYNTKTEPVDSGVSIMFATQADAYSKIYEMATETTDARPQIAENSRIVPEFLPAKLKWMTSSANNSIVSCGNGDNIIYNFKFFNAGNERKMSGWTTWELPADVVFAEYYHDSLYIITENETEEYVLSKMNLLDNPERAAIQGQGRKMEPKMDYLIQASRESFIDLNEKYFRYELPEGFYVEDVPVVLLSVLNGKETYFYQPTIEKASGTKYFDILKDDIRLKQSSSYYVGLNFSMVVELPSFFVNKDKRPDHTNLPMVTNAYLDLYQSCGYLATVNRQGYEDIEMEIPVNNYDIYSLDTSTIRESTSQPISIYMRGDQSTITLTASDPLPAALTGYSWEGSYNNRGVSHLK